ncbi:hypothetical protein SIO70_17470 [Chitinophaga sancti]|uniref:hypothetical protein n=1 Tax=Chitinophaga sancti TaxID=1004 RepID=UPI002A7655C0|nr:hypothetical protein [Chitinophaga sancti]WPQ60133.1 hypothetical protein SIO70_17470 [Chitinophaga sancti]
MESNLYLQYNKKGEEEIVWKKIVELGDLVLTEPYLDDVLLVLEDCMERVLNNFIMIKKELEENGYIFENIEELNPDYCIIEPNQEKVDLLSLQKIFPEGFIPYSLLYFYKKIRTIDFRGYFSNWENPYYLDAIYIYSLHGFLDVNQYRGEFMVDEKTWGYEVLISPDEHVKENVSGGIGYGLELTKTPRIDTNIIDFTETISFIEYLRLCLKWAGLVGLDKYEEGEIPNDILNIILGIREKIIAI